MALVDLKDCPAMLQDNVQAVTGLFFIGVGHHVKLQTVVSMKTSGEANWHSPAVEHIVVWGPGGKNVVCYSPTSQHAVVCDPPQQSV